MNPGPYDTGFNDRMVNGIPNNIEASDTSSRDIHGKLAAVVLADQLDPTEVCMKLADLAEADETPEEVFLPDGILEAMQAAV